MRFWKQAVLSTYYHGTLPLRTLRNAMSAAAGRAPVMIFTWHRIADDAANAWTTQNDVFEKEILWLKRHYDLISLEEAQQRIGSGRNDRPAACVTFDDGYRENCDHAIPLLIREQVPVTYFVTSDPVLRRECFPHDLVMGNQLRVNTLDELRAMADAGIEIGAHTRTHANVGKITDEATLYDEVIASRNDLQAALGQEIRYFAFPFGQHEHLQPRAFEMARDEGLDGVCSAYGGYHLPGEATFHLERMCVDGPLIRFMNWATVDPWKQMKIRSYDGWTETAGASTVRIAAG